MSDLGPINSTSARMVDGSYVDMVDTQSYSAIPIENVAHALALINRFNGQTYVPYSVAQHAWLVSHLVMPEYAYEGLMHDCHESVVSDITQPAKEAFRHYRASAIFSWDEMWDMHFQKEFSYRLSGMGASIVKRADLLACGLEMSFFIPPELRRWSRCPNFNLQENERQLRTIQTRIPDQFELWKHPWTWQFAKRMFQQRYDELLLERLHA